MPSKISIHLSAYPNRAFDILQKMQPGVVKVFNFSSEINIDEISRRCPNAVIVYRQYTNQDYHGAADAFFKELGDTLNKMHGRGILWEGINEPIVKSVDDAKALNAWYVRFAQLMHAQGELVAGFSWSTGNPTPDIQSAIIPYLADAAAAADVHAFHEYYSTTHGQKDWGGYRAFEQALPATARKPVVITEAGLDDNGDPHTGGWRGKITPQAYLDILKAYDALLLQDPYVLGATVFQWGDYAWPSFDLDSMIDLLANYVASVGGGLVTPRPWPVLTSPSQPTYSFSATPNTITAGQSATLKWDVDGVQAVYLDGTGVTGHSTQTVTPTQSTTYTLQLVFFDGSTKDLTATVTVTPSTGPTYSFSVTPATVSAGQSAILKWDVDGVRAVYLDGQGVTGHATRTVTPAQTTTYTLHIVFLDNSTKDLTATVTVQAVPPPQSASFSATPNTITTGASATLVWTTQGASAVSLNGQPVAASGSQVVAPTQTTTYTLHVVFADTTTKDLTATVTVVPAPPGGPTRPPTIVLTPENTAHLKTYPRPAQDNGRGLHFNIDLRDTTISNTVPHLSSIHCKWTMIFAQDELQAGRAAKACWDAGILPVVRIGKKLDEPFDPVPYVNALKAIGAPPYVQIYNEPGDIREWNHYPSPPSDAAGIFGARWGEKANLVYQAGGFPGIQCLNRGEFQAAVNAAGKDSPVWQKAFFVQHNYGANHPPAYPYDARNQQDHPGETIFQDNVGVLAFLDIAHWMMDYLGFVIPIVGGEGGWEYGASQDNRYPPVSQPYHARYHTEMFDWFRMGKLSNGEPLPDYVFSITPWIEGGWGADDWWGGVLGDKTLTTNAVAAIPPFVRLFSWDGGAPPAPMFSFLATPMSIFTGASSTLEWHVDGASDISLNGQGVVAHGTQVVAPLQTTTYALSVAFLDGTTRELSATVTVSIPPPPPGVQWDPRLDTLGVRVKQIDAPQAWRIIAVQLQDPGQSSNDHHVYFKASRADGTPAAGVKFVIDWVGRDSGAAPAMVTTDATGAVTCPLWASMNPNLQNGIYFATTKDEPGDTVSGMGLPNGRHVNFILTYQYR